jgi:5'-3' exonuclease
VADVHNADEEPDLVGRLTDSRYEAVVERGIVVTVEAFDWNCEQHITPATPFMRCSRSSTKSSISWAKSKLRPPRYASA